MKKIFILVMLAVSVFGTSYAAGIETIYEEDFENTGKLTAVQYMDENANIEQPKVTNSGLKSIDFVKEGGSNALKFTGYTSSELSGNGTKTVNFVFDKPYTLADYPNTKLVVSFSEYITLADANAYEHTYIQGGGKNVIQMFWSAKNGEAPVYRCNNKGNIGKKADLNRKIESIYVFDMENKMFDFIFDGSEFNSNSMMSDTVTQIDMLGFKIEKGHIFSVDNIKVYAISAGVPLEITEPSLNGDENVNVESGFTAKISSYIKNEDKISVTAGGTTLDKSKYSINQKYVAEDGGYVLLTLKFNEKLDYLTKYEIIFDSELKDITGTALGETKIFAFTTEKEARVYMNGVECFSGFSGTGERLISVAEANGKYVTFRISAANDFTSEKTGAFVVECCDADGNPLTKAVLEGKFIAGENSFTYGTYIGNGICSVKAYVIDSVIGGKMMSDTAVFE